MDSSIDPIPPWLAKLVAERMSSGLLENNLYNAVRPWGYEQLASTGKALVATLLNKELPSRDPIVDSRADIDRELAWKKYLGLSKGDATFAPAIYKPTISKESKATYVRLPRLESTADKEFIDTAISNILTNTERNDTGSGPSTDFIQRMFSGFRGSITRYQDWRNSSAVMGNYTVSMGRDEKGPYIAYYDKWDLKPYGIKAEKIAGKPFEIYGRIYYDPKTHQPVKELPPR